MLTPRIPVAKEGYPFIALLVFLSCMTAFLACPGLAVVFSLLTIFTLYFFRDPERVTPHTANALVSPADGKIIIVENVNTTPFTEQNALKVSIFMNVFNVHVNRIPCPGTVEQILYRPGKFYSADSVKGALQNEYCAAVIRTNGGKQLAFVQVAGLIARRIVCWLETGDQVKTGQRYGLIRFGSRVDLYLPEDTTIQVRIGDRVKAGETILGTLA